MESGGSTMLWSSNKFCCQLDKSNRLNSGADTQTRTGDLTLTKGALYRAELYQQYKKRSKRFLNLFVFTFQKSENKFKAWRCPTLTWGSPTLPSALLCFTSEFGMESGGSTML